jgi:hypothetical protein
LLFYIFNLKHDVLNELLLLDGFEGDVDLLDSTRFEGLVRLRLLHRHFEFFRKLIASSQTPVNWDSTGVSEDEGLHVGLVDKSTLEFNLLLVDSDNRLSSQALDREDSGVRVVLNKNNNLVLVLNCFLRECVDVKVLGLTNCQRHILRVHDEWGFVR